MSDHLSDKLQFVAAIVSLNLPTMSDKLQFVAAIVSLNHDHLSDKLQFVAAIISLNLPTMSDKLQFRRNRFSQPTRAPHFTCDALLASHDKLKFVGLKSLSSRPKVVSAQREECRRADNNRPRPAYRF